MVRKTVSNAYYDFFYRLVYHDLRMTFNEFATQYEMPSLGPIMYKLKTGRATTIRPATIKEVEAKLGIQIDDTDLNHITYRKHDGVLRQSGAITPLERVTLNHYPLIHRAEMQDVVMLAHQKSGKLTSKDFSSVTKDEVQLPSSITNGCAGVVVTEMNSPVINPGDILLSDLDAKITNNCYFGVILKDDRYFVGKITEHKNAATFTFHNSHYNPVIVDKSEILFITRIVQIIKSV